MPMMPLKTFIPPLAPFLLAAFPVVSLFAEDPKQLQYVDKQLLSTVDSILAHATTPPLILIQADEGFEVDSEVVGERVSQEIRVKGLSAFLLPGVPHPRVPEPPKTVNDLRLVFNTYLGTRYPMLATVSYPEHDDELYAFTDELHIP